MSPETASPNAATEPVEPPRSQTSGSWRFSLGAMFVLTAIVAIALAWWVNGPLRQARAIAEIRALGGLVNPTYTTSWSPPEPPEPWLPPDYFGEIHQVDLNRCEEASAALRAVGQLSKIGFLDLALTAITDDDLQHLAGLEIGSLWLTGCRIGDNGLKAISTVRELEVLYLAGTKVTDNGMASVAAHAKLYNLDLSRTQVGDVGISHLKRMPQLQYLLLIETKITSRGLASLAGLKKLESLELARNPISDDGLRHLAGLTTLSNLGLSGTQVTDAGLAHLAGLTSLSDLNLNGTQIHGPGLDQLAGLQKLGSLSLAHTQIGDADLLRLRPLKGLRSLRIAHGRFTQEGFDRAKADPEMKQLNIWVEAAAPRSGSAAVE